MNIPEAAAPTIIDDGYLIMGQDRELQLAASAVFEAAYRYFRSAPDEKLLDVISPYSGYRPMGVEYSSTSDRPDLMESFTVTSRESGAETCRSTGGRELYAVVTKLREYLEAIAESLAEQLALSMMLPEANRRSFAGAFTARSCVQLNYSRPAISTRELINDPHEDGHLLTLAMADGMGLEVETAEGAYIPVLGQDPILVVMPGEIAQLLSGGIIRPCFHQVRRDPQLAERISIVYFGDVDLGTL